MINFRVWDIKSEVIRVVQIINYYRETALVGEENDVVERDFKELKFMQSTGIVVKNGTEIYEGDIVHFVSEYLDSIAGELNVGYDVKGEVKFESGAFWIGETPLFFLLECDPLLTSIRILGNKYENKELL